MGIPARIEAALADALRGARRTPAPQRLGAALEHAVLPGGARIRPTILTAVAMACGDDRPRLTDAAGAALELIHCASLVHDDMPCFDDAPLRRGKPAVHVAFSEEIALLTGDSLIVLAFGTLARAGRIDPARAAALSIMLAERTGMPGGICAGQGWESERDVDVAAYHRAKTGSLFMAATQMGAAAAGHDPEAWEDLGALIGEAFQVADDLRDALLTEAEMGKPAGQDAVHARPSAVAERGVSGAAAHLRDILAGAIASIPACPGEAMLAEMVTRQARAMVPTEGLARYAAE